jgi:hypothetical protein
VVEGSKESRKREREGEEVREEIVNGKTSDPNTDRYVKIHAQEP